MSQMPPALELVAVKVLQLPLRCFNQGDPRPFILYTDNTEGSEAQQLEIDDRDDRETESLVESARQVISWTLNRGRSVARHFD